MGRKKIEVKRIEDRCNRHVTFCKRKSGLFKKAHEISILCDVEVGLAIFTDRGRLYEFCSGNSLLNIFEGYKSHLEGRTQSLIRIDAQGHQSSQASLVSLGKLLQTVQSLVGKLDFEKLNVTDLVQLENQLEVTLRQIQSQRIGAMKENGG